MLRPLVAFSLSLTLALTLPAADWPQFLGPNRDGTSPEKVAPWKGELKPAWKAPVGDAHSSPVVADGVVYAFYQPKGKDADALAAFDARTGKQLWEKSYGRAKFNPPFGAGPRSTPAISGGKVYTLGNTGILACWDAKTGDIVWKEDTLKEFKAPNLFFGISTSPLIEGDSVVVMVGGKGAGIVAFDKATGKPRWQATDDPASYASAIAVGTGADRQIIALTGSHLRGLSPTGKDLWAVPFTAKVGKFQLVESSTTPVVAGEYVIGSSVTDGSIGLKVKHTGGKWTAEQAWKNRALTCYFSTPVVVGKHLFMVNGSTSLLNPAITLRCVELETGKVAWEKPKVGRFHAALVRTGDDKLLMLDDNGYLTLLAADPKEYKQLARSKVCGETWAHPALVDGKVYLRDEKELICVPVRRLHVYGVGLILAAGLVGFGLVTAARQRRTAARLREERFLPSDERAYLRGQVRRRLATSVVVVAIGGMIGYAYVSGMERRATDIAGRTQKENEHPPAGPENDPGRPPDHQPPTDDDRAFVKLWGYYWIAVLVLVFVAVCCATHDFWVTRRYWMAQYKLIKADHEAKLRRDLAAYRAAKDNDRMHGRGGNKPDNGSADDTDEHPPAGE